MQRQIRFAYNTGTTIRFVQDPKSHRRFFMWHLVSSHSIICYYLSQVQAVSTLRPQSVPAKRCVPETTRALTPGSLRRCAKNEPVCVEAFSQGVVGDGSRAEQPLRGQSAAARWRGSQRACCWRRVMSGQCQCQEQAESQGSTIVCKGWEKVQELPAPGCPSSEVHPGQNALVDSPIREQRREA